MRSIRLDVSWKSPSSELATHSPPSLATDSDRE
jgi:hypothetical protein